jgi:alcohol dehydrogenase YqhD (iron-dependent ADH family)
VKSGLLDCVKDSLKTAGVAWVELAGVKPNPRVSLVREGIGIVRSEKIGLVLAVGGGSVLDSAKAIGLGVPYEGDEWDFHCKKAVPKAGLPVGCVMTIPATGSEQSDSCVITNEETCEKRGVNTEWNRPVFSILDPELTLTLPPFQTACGIVDMFTHVLERYFTKEPNVELTDRLCEAVMRTIIRNAPVVMAEPDNYAARAEIMLSASVAHNNFLSQGRVGDWACHGIEHAMSAFYDIAHGAGLAIVFPAWFKYVLKEDAHRFARFATEVWGVDSAWYSEEQAGREGIARFEAFSHRLGLPTTFTDAKLPTDRFNEMAEHAVRFPLGNFRRLTKEDVVAIYNLAK